MIVGVVGDLHLPFTHPNYLEFCSDIFKAWRVDHVVLIGDVVDQHALGFWEHDPDGKSAGDELEIARSHIRAWSKRFPQADVCIGNHDARYARVAHRAGIPVQYLRTYADVFDTPGWKWKFQHTHQRVLYDHGTGISGKYAAMNFAVTKRMSAVIGHTHTYGGALYHSNETSRIFGLQVGCGIDNDAYAFAYGKHFAVRPTLGCGIVVDGTLAVFEPMTIGRGEPYRRKRRA